MAKFVIYGRPGCPWCEKAKQYLSLRNVGFKYVNVRESEANMHEFREWFPDAQTVPQIMYWHDENTFTRVGGYTDLEAFFPRNLGEGSLV